MIAREYIVFELASAVYYAAAKDVCEIISADLVSEKYGVSQDVVGAIVRSGSIFPVVGLRNCLQIATDAETGKQVIVIEATEFGKVGFLVDDVKGVAKLEDSEIAEIPNVVIKDDVKYVSGVVREGGKAILIIDLPAVLKGRANPADALNTEE